MRHGVDLRDRSSARIRELAGISRLLISYIAALGIFCGMVGVFQAKYHENRHGLSGKFSTVSGTSIILRIIFTPLSSGIMVNSGVQLPNCSVAEYLQRSSPHPNSNLRPSSAVKVTARTGRGALMVDES